MKGTPNPGLNLHTFIACCIKLSQEYFRGSPDPLDAMVSQCELYLKLEKADPDAALREREREMRRRRRKKGGDDWSKRRNSDGGGRYSGESERYSLVGYLPPLDFTVGSAPPGKKGTTDSALTGQMEGMGSLKEIKKRPVFCGLHHCCRRNTRTATSPRLAPAIRISTTCCRTFESESQQRSWR